MRLLAISDLHVNSGANLRHLCALAPRPDDWLIVAGDVCERVAGLAEVLALLGEKFARVIWVPGNHELWTEITDGGSLRGVAKYEAMVEAARGAGALTPEDPYPIWPGPGPACVIAPLFLLYDYSFRPVDVPLARVVEWSAEDGIQCTDEVLLSPEPHRSRIDWCRARCRLTARRLETEVPSGHATVLVNHYPLRRDLVHIPRIPRFSPWCGTTATQDWHLRFNAAVCVSGHLHVRRTDWRDGVRFEEVSLGYARHWNPAQGLKRYLRQILPAPEIPPDLEPLRAPPRRP
jgi:predicted phosphodiesterase